ncbi:hypothetical protein OSB04_011971 [Centaurea solstitialis]|uniref:non-specific serine/threonine protein kinase n=1 Tax=Centaurea solstitialis TaxID=347529 RepID=A0AA38WE66_9ASTR|nr:hypothetical protein OSB04_011971 [Centaurea solstitialis]
MKLPFLITFLFFVLFTCCHSNNSHFNSLKKQASILISLKQSFKPSDHPSLDSWNHLHYPSLCSNWTGIECDTTTSSIISLDLSNLNLSGTLSPEITQLRSLQNLSLAGNGFSGAFPKQVHELSDLRVLNISNNMFDGGLEFDFAMLKSLRVLDAYNNNFTGLLPVGVSRLSGLNHLNLGGNYFSGEIPADYGRLSRLTFLHLGGNDLRGFVPRELGNLTSLNELLLGYFNQFSGGIPAEFGGMVRLVHLDLSNCGLEGEIPKELGNLTNLDTLFLQTNRLVGLIPFELGNLVNLKYLDLSNNQIAGEVPPELSALKELRILNLFINRLHGDISMFVAELPNLEVLNLWDNNFTGIIPPNLGRNGRLKQLDLSTNKLTGVIPKFLCFGRKLETLILFNNFLFGSLPDDLGKCRSLGRVRLGQNYLSGSLPNGFLYLPELSLVELQNNYLAGLMLEGSNPNVNSRLAQLNLSNNRLSGVLPASIGNFSEIKILLLDGNKLSGEVPPEIGGLRSVLKMDLSRNKFSGGIPPEIARCSSLTYLDLSRNELTGSIPPRISELRILNYLNVSWNHLAGTLPDEFGSMKSLTAADFSYNNFSGSIPETGQYSVFKSTSFEGNPYLCRPFSNRPCHDSASDSPRETDGQPDNKTTKVPARYKLVFALGLLVCSLAFVILAVIKTRKMRTAPSKSSWKLTAFQKLEFGSEDILECLKDNNVIGQGGAGVVYGGTMPNGEQVAIKKLGTSKGNNNGCSHDSGLSAEIQTLGRIRHRYIVRLMALCSNKETNLLVYEYMPNGSLGELLHGKKGGCVLKWDMRLKIAIEAATGLCYLHHDCSPLIIHRDVKSNNILLSSDFEAHVADFGLAKFLQEGGASECMSAIAGSYGYIAPEYAYTLKIDEKSDVYSYGVVLLELITGRRPVGDFGEDGLDIVRWSKMQTNGTKEGVGKILDERLKKVPMDEAKQVFFVAMLCVQEHNVERPTMREVVQMLAQAKNPNAFQMR